MIQIFYLGNNIWLINKIYEILQWQGDLEQCTRYGERVLKHHKHNEILSFHLGIHARVATCSRRIERWHWVSFLKLLDSIYYPFYINVA